LRRVEGGPRSIVDGNIQQGQERRQEWLQRPVQGEEFAHLPRAISKEGKRTHTYEVGDFAYWAPGPDVAIFYRHDGQEIPDPGIIVIGKIDSGVEALNVPSSVEVTVELIK
jgi:hypothetical protein